MLLLAAVLVGVFRLYGDMRSSVTGICGSP